MDEVSITSLSLCPKSSHPLFPGHLQRFALPTEAPALPWSSAPRLGSRLVSGVASVTPRRSCPLGLGRLCSATDPGSGETGPLPQRTPDASFFLTFTDSNHLLSLLSLLQFIQFSIGKKNGLFSYLRRHVPLRNLILARLLKNYSASWAKIKTTQHRPPTHRPLHYKDRPPRSPRLALTSLPGRAVSKQGVFFFFYFSPNPKLSLLIEERGGPAHLSRDVSVCKRGLRPRVPDAFSSSLLGPS